MSKDPLQFTKHAVSNGMVLWHNDMDIPFIQLSVVVPIGSAHSIPEVPPEKSAGLAHLLEHMCLKRSRLYPEHNAFAHILTDVGGRWNAWTYDFHTEYFLTAPKHAVNTDLLQGFLSHIFDPTFTKVDLEKEQALIREEAAVHNFYPGDNSVSQYKFTKWMHLHATTPEQVFGIPGSFPCITIDDLAKLHAYYRTPGTNIFLGGNIDPAVLPPLLATYQTSSRTVVYETSESFWYDQTYRHVPNTELATHVLSWGGIYKPPTLEEYWSINFIIQLLTDDEYGLLYRWLREEKNWSYSVYSFQSTQSDRLAWIIDMPIPSTQAANIVRQSLPDLVRNTIHDSVLLERAKHIERGRLCYAYQTVFERVDVAIETICTFKHMYTTADFVNWLNKVDTETLISIYDRYFTPDVTSMILMTPTDT